MAHAFNGFMWRRLERSQFSVVEFAAGAISGIADGIQTIHRQ
jgi:hypothetical protein